jgi:hypothetical protein
MKVGSYDIPDMRLYPRLVEAAKLIYEKFASEEAKDLNLVAQLLGHDSANSGAFLSKLAQLRAYGLIERRGVKVTDLGKKLTFPTNEEELKEARKQAILNIPLWREFYSKWGLELPNGNFWADLAKIANLEAPEAKRIEQKVRNAYISDIRYLKTTEELEKETESMPSQPPSKDVMSLIIPSQNMSMSLPLTEENIDIIISALNALKKRIGSVKSEAPKKEG